MKDLQFLDPKSSNILPGRSCSWLCFTCSFWLKTDWQKCGPHLAQHRNRRLSLAGEAAAGEEDEAQSHAWGSTGSTQLSGTPPPPTGNQHLPLRTWGSQRLKNQRHLTFIIIEGKACLY